MRTEESTVYEILDNHGDMLADHELRLKVHEGAINELKNGQMKLENTVMLESRETRKTITDTNDQLHTLIRELMGYKTDERKLNADVKIKRIEVLAKIIGILAGSGGILYYIFT